MTITEIIKLASDYSGIEPHEIHIKTRKEEVVIARQLAHYMAKKKTDLSLANIGKLIGNKDHATVLHSINTIENYLSTPNRHQKPLLVFMKKADILTVDIDNIQVMPSLMKVVFSQNTLSSSALDFVRTQCINKYGSGSGSGSGDDYGSGSGSGLKMINNQKVYLIDGVQTIIKSIKGNLASGFIVNSDLTLTPCFIAKGENQFAHGSTAKEAVESLQSKLLKSTPIEKRIEMFKAKFKNDVKYPAIEFYDWHHILTGSCKFGRDSWCKDRGINIDSDTFTVKEFIELTKNSYGSDVINQLKKSK